MQLNLLTKQLSSAARWITTTVLCVSAIAFIWQGAFSSNMTAMANPNTSLIAAMDAGDKVQEKASKDAGRAKGFIEDTKDKVKQTAKNNAAKVDRATDANDNVFERKAKKDASFIEKRAEEDADRTQKAVDNTKNAVERTVDSIKDAFN
ncbi:hypothetical protein JOY44_15400 [Phormidium sp. CLA17]|uniref:hypothetical protein n=1 Tax=Leptolyngbya sp. Cla-17 TaxID=2803751 RepID=UPI001490BD47|nr:hypothetical protein [Leptolyngbya sp. Cla-17]MBM0742974.1 hypothetical protein [Leptolyngbya sp. Cla-17]